MVQRSDLTDLLIAPMQHQCHYQLLLEVSLWPPPVSLSLSFSKCVLQNVLKATSQPSEKSLLTSAIKAFVVALSEQQSSTCTWSLPPPLSLEELQGNITAQQRSEELLELQETLSWPSLASLCPDSYIPEVRKCHQLFMSDFRSL